MMRKYAGALLLLGLLPADTSGADVLPLTLKQRDQLRTHIPRTFAKLDGRRPVHIVALGDSVTEMYTLDADSGNWLKSYVGDFGERLAREFFYPGGVRALNPDEGKPAKLKEHLGEEILIENLAIGGRCALDAIQRVTTDAFVNDPDLVLINFGINDSNRGYSLDSYRQALQRSIEACRANRSDVIVLAPNLIRASSGPTGWGKTRQHATIAKEVAKENGVLCVDLGAGLAPLGGGVPAGAEPEAAVLTMSDRLGRIFEYSPPPTTPDVLHPNAAAHAVMGRILFETLVEEPKPAGPYSLNARAIGEDNGRIKLRLSLRNQSDQVRAGYIGALAMGESLTPEKPYRIFDLRPGKNAEIEIDYLRAPSPNTPGGHVALDIADPPLRLSFFVIDDSGSRIMDVVTRLEPVAVTWTAQTFRNLTKELRLEWEFLNGSTAATRGKYRIGMGEAASDWVAFDLDPLGGKKFQATFPFKPVEGAARFKLPVFIDIEVGGKIITFPRELEAVKDLALGERVSLSRAAEYTDGSRKPLAGAASLPTGENGVVMRTHADENYLYFTFDIEGLALQPVPGGQSLLADLSIDARPSSEVGAFGFVDRLRVSTGVEDGKAVVERPQLGVFGDGYNMILMPEGVTAALESRTAESKRLEVAIPRSYLFRHEWRVGDPASFVGLNVNLMFGTPDAATNAVAYPEDRRYVLTAPQAGFDRTMYLRDPRGLGVLRLSTSPSVTWSAHLY
jgi:lysophospholipase L1-like esterase